MKLLHFLVFAAIGFAVTTVRSETVKDREGSVREDKAKMEKDDRWIYNDVDAGFEAARKSGKPLMVVIRCVPCIGCMGIDTEVLVENSQLTPLMDQFVRVRVINANSLDLSRFQFDYDLSFSTMFFNGDGTVYGRFGSWSHQKDGEKKAVDSYKRALEGALALHNGYPANKPALAGKQGEPNRYRTPVDMPQLSDKYRAELDWQGKVVQSCVHCHQIGDATRLAYRESRQPIPLKWIYAFPASETIGITLADDRLPTVTEIMPDSPGAEAGLKPGDRIVALQDQPLISTADFTWVLHQGPDSGSLEALVERSGARKTLAISLPDGWRTKMSLKRRVGTWPMRAMAFGGMLLEELPDDERRKLKIERDRMALLAKHVGQYGKHAAAKREGFKKDDILISVGGDSARIDESGLIGRMIQNHQPGAKVPTTILRNGKELELKIPVQ